MTPIDTACDNFAFISKHFYTLNMFLFLFFSRLLTLSVEINYYLSVIYKLFSILFIFKNTLLRIVIKMRLKR